MASAIAFSSSIVVGLWSTHLPTKLPRLNGGFLCVVAPFEALVFEPAALPDPAFVALEALVDPLVFEPEALPDAPFVAPEALDPPPADFLLALFALPLPAFPGGVDGEAGGGAFGAVFCGRNLSSVTLMGNWRPPVLSGRRSAISIISMGVDNIWLVLPGTALPSSGDCSM